MRTLVLYSRPGCHLCDALLEELEPLVAGRATLEIVDVDADPALCERYGTRIPVLVGDGAELSGYPLDPAPVRAYLGSR